MTALVVLETIVLALLCVLVAGLLRSHATILRKLHELGVGIETDEPVRTTRRRAVAPERRPWPEPAGSGGRNEPAGSGGRSEPAGSGGRSEPAGSGGRTEPAGSGGRNQPAGSGGRAAVPPPGGRRPSAPAHDVVGVSLDDEAVAVRVVGSPTDTLLVFLSSGCATCGAYWEALGDPDLALPSDARLVVVVRDPDEEHPALLHELAPAGLQVLHSTRAWTDYEVPGSPYVVMADGATGRLRGEGTAPTLQQVLSMLGRARDDAAHRVRLDARRGDKAAADAAREAAVDEELLAAGVQPGDPSLYRPVDEGSGR